MPKQLKYLYADFETTPIKIPKNYKNAKQLIKDNVFYEKPIVYSWCITHDIQYGVLNEETEYKDYGVKIDKDKDIISYYGVDIYSFILFISQLKNDTWIYFNNLKGFDGHYIIPGLDELGFKIVVPYELDELSMNEKDYNYYENLRNERIIKIKELILNSKTNKTKYINFGDIWLEKQIKKNWNNLMYGEYSLLCNENSQIYEIKIASNNFKYYKSIKNNRIISIRDNLLLFPTSIKKMGEEIAKYYIKEGMNEIDAQNRFYKQSINYNDYKIYQNYKELENDNNELDYVIQDTYILYKYHELMSLYFPKNKWKLTIASTSYSEWVRLFGDEILIKYINIGLVKEVELERGATAYRYKNKNYLDYKLKKILIDELFPVKWLDTQYNSFTTIHENIYDEYNGGITTLNESYRGQYLENLTYLDVNSSYPSSMMSDIEAPYGIGYKGNNKECKYKIYKIFIKDTIINKKGLPFLFDMNTGTRQYLRVLKKGMEIIINTYEYERFLKYYEPIKTSYKIEVLWSFETISMKKIFGSYINKWYMIKENAGNENNEVLKSIAKLFLNSLYGKFGTKSIRISRFWNQFSQQWEKSVEYLESKFYLPIAGAITSLSRMKLVDAVNYNYDKFIYSDTDSIIIKDFNLKDFNYLDIDKNRLGAWDIEGVFNGVFRRPKQYMLKNIDINCKPKLKLKLAFAGINFNADYLPDDDVKEVNKNIKIFEKLTYYDFLIGKNENGTIIKNQTKPERILGSGIIIDNIEKRIKPIWEYKPLREQIYITKEDYFNSWKNKNVPW